ncbi:MAG: zinc ribbon domain-containing protein, partial [Acidobacteriota bacterium]|nr:zinc ribbon domain-containing protein [Acidobacteriota bacterium]
MSLIICPECANEVSSTATACPNCGHPFVRPIVPPKVIVREMPPEKEGFPTWAFIPLGILGVVLLFVVFVFMRNGSADDARSNLNIRVATESPISPASGTTTTVHSEPPPSQIIVPPSTSSSSTVVAPP